MTKFATAPYRLGKDFQWGDVAFLSPPKLLILYPLTDRAATELREREGISPEAISVVRTIRQIGDLSQLDFVLRNVLLTFSRIRERPTPDQIRSETRLADIEASTADIPNFVGRVNRVFRSAIGGLPATAAPPAFETVGEAIDFIRNEFLPSPAPVLNELLGWANYRESAKQLDSGTLAYMAVQKWDSTCKFGNVARSMEDFRKSVERDPKVEVTAMTTFSTKPPTSQLLGACLFHRTFANNLFIDFLADHPAAVISGQIVSGIARPLLHHVALIGDALRSPWIWAETTDGSAPVYSYLFQAKPRRNRSDFLEVSRTKYRAFTRHNRALWDTALTPITQPGGAGTKNPPGNPKFEVRNPKLQARSFKLEFSNLGFVWPLVSAIWIFPSLFRISSFVLRNSNLAHFAQDFAGK